MIKTSFAYDSSVCVLEFKDKISMKECLESYATEYEGSVESRVGYNFEYKGGSAFPKGTKYVIGYTAGDTHTKMHEMLHAKYFVSGEYRKQINKLWSSLSSDDQNKITKVLYKFGYPKEVHLDEFQAYLLSEKNPERFFGIKFEKGVYKRLKS